MALPQFSQQDDTDRKKEHGSSAGFKNDSNSMTSNAPLTSLTRNREQQRIGGNNDVSTLVAKSKKAAASLFTLLHAKVRIFRRISAPFESATTVLIFYLLSFLFQNCRLGVNRCPHPGCSEAKLIFLHLKVSIFYRTFSSPPAITKFSYQFDSFMPDL